MSATMARASLMTARPTTPRLPVLLLLAIVLHVAELQKASGECTGYPGTCSSKYQGFTCIGGTGSVGSNICNTQLRVCGRQCDAIRGCQCLSSYFGNGDSMIQCRGTPLSCSSIGNAADCSQQGCWWNADAGPPVPKPTSAPTTPKPTSAPTPGGPVCTDVLVSASSCDLLQENGSLSGTYLLLPDSYPHRPETAGPHMYRQVAADGDDESQAKILMFHRDFGQLIGDGEWYAPNFWVITSEDQLKSSPDGDEFLTIIGLGRNGADPTLDGQSTWIRCATGKGSIVFGTSLKASMTLSCLAYDEQEQEQEQEQEEQAEDGIEGGTRQCEEVIVTDACAGLDTSYVQGTYRRMDGPLPLPDCQKESASTIFYQQESDTVFFYNGDHWLFSYTKDYCQETGNGSAWFDADTQSPLEGTASTISCYHTPDEESLILQTNITLECTDSSDTSTASFASENTSTSSAGESSRLQLLLIALSALAQLALCSST